MALTVTAAPPVQVTTTTTLATDRPLHARVAATNTASRRVLEKVGFRLVDEPPSTVTRRGVEVTELALILE